MCLRWWKGTIINTELCTLQWEGNHVYQLTCQRLSPFDGNHHSAADVMDNTAGKQVSTLKYSQFNLGSLQPLWMHLRSHTWGTLDKKLHQFLLLHELTCTHCEVLGTHCDHESNVTVRDVSILPPGSASLRRRQSQSIIGAVRASFQGIRRS